MPLGEQEPVPVRVVDGVRGDPQDPVVEHPEHVEGGVRARRVLLVAGQPARAAAGQVGRGGRWRSSWSCRLACKLKCTSTQGTGDARSSLTIGELSARSGVAPSALRYYERLGLIRADAHRRQPAPVRPRRAAPGRVHPDRPAGRRLAGGDPRGAATRCPSRAPPRKADWAAAVRALAEPAGRADRAAGHGCATTSTGCIGCGCLSLQRCTLYNPDDRWPREGPGARAMLGPPTGTRALGRPQPVESAAPCRCGRCASTSRCASRGLGHRQPAVDDRPDRARLDQRPDLLAYAPDDRRLLRRAAGTAARSPMTDARLASSAPRSSSALRPPCMPITTSRPPVASAATFRPR